MDILFTLIFLGKYTSSRIIPCHNAGQGLSQRKKSDIRQKIVAKDNTFRSDEHSEHSDQMEPPPPPEDTPRRSPRGRKRYAEIFTQEEHSEVWQQITNRPYFYDIIPREDNEDDFTPSNAKRYRRAQRSTQAKRQLDYGEGTSHQ